MSWDEAFNKIKCNLNTELWFRSYLQLFNPLIGLSSQFQVDAVKLCAAWVHINVLIGIYLTPPEYMIICFSSFGQVRIMSFRQGANRHSTVVRCLLIMRRKEAIRRISRWKFFLARPLEELRCRSAADECHWGIELWRIELIQMKRLSTGGRNPNSFVSCTTGRGFVWWILGRRFLVWKDRIKCSESGGSVVSLFSVIWFVLFIIFTCCWFYIYMCCFFQSHPCDFICTYLFSLPLFLSQYLNFDHWAALVAFQILK